MKIEFAWNSYKHNLSSTYYHSKYNHYVYRRRRRKTSMQVKYIKVPRTAVILLDLLKLWSVDLPHSGLVVRKAFLRHDVDGLMQERLNSIANALELSFSCIIPSMG